MSSSAPLLMSAPEVLQTKLRIWRKRLQYTQETRSGKEIARCEQAVSDLTARLVAHGVAA